MTSLVRVVVLPALPAATTVKVHLPAVRLNGTLNEPSPPTVAVWTGGGAGVGGGLVVVVAATEPANTALTVTWVAFVAEPVTRIAPFWKVAPSAGWSRVRPGVTIAEIGTLMTRA